MLALIYLNPNTGCYVLEVEKKAKCYSLILSQENAFGLLVLGRTWHRPQVTISLSFVQLTVKGEFHVYMAASVTGCS